MKFDFTSNVVKTFACSISKEIAGMFGGQMPLDQFLLGFCLEFPETQVTFLYAGWLFLKLLRHSRASRNMQNPIKVE